MSENTIRIAPDSTGQYLRTQVFTVGGTMVNQEVVTLADTSGNYYAVSNPFPVSIPTPVSVSQSTASNLNAAVVGVGTAGTPSGGVLTVQGASAGTPIPVSGSFSAIPNVPNIKSISAAATFNNAGGGAPQNIITAPGGSHVISIYGLNWNYTPHGSGVPDNFDLILEDTAASTILGIWRFDAVTADLTINVGYMNFQGLPLSTGAGLQWAINATPPSTLSMLIGGSVTYTST